MKRLSKPHPKGPTQKNITGLRNGLLVAVRSVGRKKWGYYWLCKCDCGKTTEVLVSNFFKTKSCGCLRHRTKHGFLVKGKSRGVYAVWAAMLQRCLNPKHKHYASYGGRGIRVCVRWFGFKNFLKDMGERPPKTSLERKDNNQGYSPGNCKWATQKEQTRNTRQNHLLTLNGQTKCIADWAEHFKIRESLLRSRISDGLSLEQALNRPYGSGKFITFNGHTRSISSWARELGLEPSALIRRLSKGWSLEKALTGGDKRKVFVTFMGKTKSIADWARSVGVDQDTLQSRLKKGWPIRKAFQRSNQKKVFITYRGQTKCLSDWERTIGLRPGILHDRLKRGLTVKQALAEISHERA